MHDPLIPAFAMSLLNVPGSSGQRLHPRHLDRLVEKARNRFNVPAMFVAIVDTRQVGPYCFSGVRVQGGTETVGPNDHMHIGSCSKSVLALIAGHLVEQGKLEWDTRFLDLFPSFAPMALAGYHGITLEDLFLCRAGIKPFVSGQETFPDTATEGPDAIQAFIAWLLQQPPSAPRTTDGKFEHLYSNAGYSMAAAMCEAASGSTYEDLVRELVNGELGAGVHFGWPNRMGPDQPWGHGNFIFDPVTLVERTGVQQRPFPPEDPYAIHPLIRPAGDISMRPLDFAHYVQMHLRGIMGMPGYVTTATFMRIHFGHPGFSIGVGNGHMHGRRISGFSGSAGTFWSQAVLLPEDGIAVVVMLNSGSQRAADRVTMSTIRHCLGWWWKFWM